MIRVEDGMEGFVGLLKLGNVAQEVDTWTLSTTKTSNSLYQQPDMDITELTNVPSYGRVLMTFRRIHSTTGPTM